MKARASMGATWNGGEERRKGRLGGRHHVARAQAALEGEGDAANPLDTAEIEEAMSRRLSDRLGKSVARFPGAQRLYRDARGAGEAADGDERGFFGDGRGGPRRVAVGRHGSVVGWYGPPCQLSRF